MASQATALAAEPFMAATAAIVPPTIHGYHMLRLLGEGGMGQVWLADDLTLGRRVAIKTIAAAHAGEGGARTRFLREARVMATVEHPHVVRVYAYGDAAGLAYFVMEFVDGETLAARLRRAACLAPSEALRITRQVALALASAWQRGVVHRDVKPSNVLLDEESRVRVADFGLARAAPTSGDHSLTYPGAVVGSPHYMSPEQARGRSVDFRSDIYSLGVVLFEMLAGARPFEGQSPVEVIAHHLHDPLPPLHDRRRDLSPAVVALVEDMTAKEPERRPSSYKALLQRIEGSAYVDASQGSTSMPTSTMPSLRRPVARRRVVVGLTGLALATALGAAWWARGRSIPPAPAGSLAVVAFYGPDEASSREGRMLAALVEAELGRRLGDNLRVIGVDDAGPPIRSESGGPRSRWPPARRRCGLGPEPEPRPPGRGPALAHLGPEQPDPDPRLHRVRRGKGCSRTTARGSTGVVRCRAPGRGPGRPRDTTGGCPPPRPAGGNEHGNRRPGRRGATASAAPANAVDATAAEDARAASRSPLSPAEPGTTGSRGRRR